MKRIVALSMVLVLCLSLMMAVPAGAAVSADPTVALTGAGTTGITSVTASPTGSGTEAGVHTIVVTDAALSTATGTDAEDDGTADAIATAIVTGVSDNLTATIAGGAISVTLAPATAGTTTLAAVAADIEAKINAATTAPDVDVTVTVAGASNAKYFVITVNAAGVNNSITAIGGTAATPTGFAAPVLVDGTDAKAVDTLTPATGSNGLWQADASYGNSSTTMTIAHSPAAGTASALPGLEALVEAADAFIEGITIDAAGALAAGTAIVTVTAGQAYLAVTGTATMTAGTTNALTITAYDSAANRATSYTGDKNLTFSGPSTAPDTTVPSVTDKTAAPILIGSLTTITFTNGISTAGGVLTAYSTETTNVDVTDGTIDSSGDPAYDLDLTVNSAAIDHYTVTAIGSPKFEKTPFNVTIQAQDIYDNDITIGADASENITITFGLADLLASPTSTTTTNGAVTVSAVFFTIQDGQSITFTGDTSAEVIVSNLFDIDPRPIATSSWAGPTIRTTLFGDATRFSINNKGEIYERIEATSKDGSLTMTIPRGTIATDGEGNPLETMKTDLYETPPAPPKDAHIIGLTYDFGPNGAVFDPAITLEYTYDPDDLPEGINEEDLVIAYYDEDAGQWVELSGIVDPATNTITADVNHFTVFTIIASAPAPTASPLELAPAAFASSSLSVSPLEVSIGETVTISIQVSNTGEEAGSYAATLEINEIAEETKEITLAGGASGKVTFTTSMDKAGIYSVNIDSLTGSFTVKEAVSPSATEPVTTAPAPEPEQSANWPTIVGIIAGVVVIGLIIYFIIRRRRKAV